MDKQYYWEQAERAMHQATQASSSTSETYSEHVKALVRLAEANLKMMEAAPYPQ